MATHFPGPRRGAILIVVCACLAFVTTTLLRQAGALEQTELAHYDRVVARVAARELAAEVVLVTIDDTDLAAWGWPVPDGRIADILFAIDRADPAVIGLDVYRDTPIGADNAALQRAFAATRTIGITKLGPSGGLTVGPPAGLADREAYGFSDIPVDRDGVVRRSLLLVNTPDGLQLSFAFRLAMARLGQDGIRPWPDDPRVLMLGDAPLPALTPRFGGYVSADTAGYQIPLRFGHALPVARTIPARDVLARGAEAALRGKIVIIGTNSDSIKDYFRTPLNRAEGARFTYGSQVHAAAVQSLLDVASGARPLLRDLPLALQHALLALAALAGAGLGRVARSGAGLALVLPGAIVALIFGFDAALTRGVWAPAIPSLLAFGTGFVLCFGTLAVLARRQRRIMETLFSDHLSPDLAAQIWENRATFLSGSKPRPQLLDTTVLFVDLAGSTAIGGKTDPARFVDWISRGLDALSDVARDHGGFIEKFTGDGLLIAFGAPLKQTSEAGIAEDARRACLCAVALGAEVRALNDRNADDPPYRIRIGLHSGQVYGGVLGHSGTLKYNLVGDTVNIAARIEAFGKTLQDRQAEAALVCLSETTRRLAGGAIDAEPVGTLRHDDGVRTIDVYCMKAVG